MNLPTGYTACPRCDRAYRTSDGHTCSKAAARPAVRPHETKPGKRKATACPTCHGQPYADTDIGATPCPTCNPAPSPRIIWPTSITAVPVRVPTPNATETRILHALAEMTGTQPHDWEYEGYEMTLANGHSYTPDWINRARRIVVECKGTYSHGSRQRSRLAFHQAWAEYRCEWSFIWAQEVEARKGCPKHIKMEVYQ